MELAPIVEALLFACQEPLTVAEMSRAIRETAREAGESGLDQGGAKRGFEAVTDGQVRAALDELIGHYERAQRSFTVVERSAGWRLCARAEFADWCRALYPGKRPAKMSAPALETLAIIAYRQPVTKAVIESVRGVSVDGVLQQLIDRGLVTVEGRADLPGRPLLYATTDLFLDHFGIRNIEDLPNSEELRRVKLPEPAQAAASGSTEPAQRQLGIGETAGQPA